MSEQICRSCERPVTWAITKNGRSMPLDPEPVAGGNIRYTGACVTGDNERTGPEIEVLTNDGGLLDDGEPRYVSHFATCPNAEKHRR